MASSPAKFLFALLVFAAVGWVVFVFAARLLAWFLSRVLKASVEFRVAGCNCLRDVTVKFQKGAIESLSVGEIKLSLRKSLVKLGFSFISGDPKLQLVICDLEVVVRPTEKSIDKSVNKSKPKSSRKSSPGKGKWMLVTNISRFLSVSVTELAVKAPKASIEIKDLRVDISKDGGPNPVLYVKLYVNPLLVQVFDSHSFDHSGFDQGDFSPSGQICPVIMERDSAPFIWEKLSLACEFGHEKEGITIKNVDLTSGDIIVNLNENLIVKTKKKSNASVGDIAREGATLDVTTAKKSQNNKLSSLLRKHIIPEKVSFNLPKLDVKFRHLGQGLVVENNVMGIQFRCSKSAACEDSGETTPRFDVQMDFSEIHLIREGAKSILEILKVAVTGSIDVPVQLLQPVRAEVDVKLGGTQCNVMINRLKPWLRLQSSKKKSMVLRDESSQKERPQNQISKLKTIMWTCTLSAPEMTIVVYCLNDLPLYHVCSQSSHLFANNIASKGIQVHGELGELHLHMADDYQECLKESLFSVEINSGSLVHIARVSLDWGHREVDSQEGNDPNKMKLIFSVDVTGMEVNFGFKHVESLISTMLSFKGLLKSVSGSTKRAPQGKVVRSSKTTSKGTQILKLNLDKCSVNYCGDISTEDTIVADPKRVNYGSQGGEKIVSVSADGSPRTASITSTAPSACKKIKFSASLNISHLNLSLNKEKHSMQIDLERARSIYQEYCEENNPGAKVTILDMQNAKFVRRSGGLNEIAVCSLVNVTDIAVRWEPDVQLAATVFMASLKSVVQNQKNQLLDSNEIKDESAKVQDIEPEKEVTHSKKKESIFAIDVEKLQVSAGLADGVETVVNVQSIFSENARIGVLLEELVLSFNDTRIFKSSRMQISRIPVSVTNNSIEAKAQSTTTWDWVIQGPDVHICLPYRLQLRAIDDAVEDTLRGLKLIAAAKTNLLVPKKENSKRSKHKSTNFGSIRLIIRKLKADIEEEPIQGWLDEHYHMMKNEVCERAVRSKFLDEFVSGSKSGDTDTTIQCSDKKFFYNEVEIDASDKSAIKSLHDEIHRQAFRSYYQACQRLNLAEGSGACLSGFQSGFKPSTNRASLLTISATELDLTLSKIEGGNVGMIEFINKVDPVSLENQIPFSRMYGRDISLSAGTLTVQLRDYTFPLFAAAVGKCQGRLVLAQQSTFFQPQIEQDIFIGRWWKVRMLRSASGTSPAMKTYMDLPLYFQKAEVSFGVGYEPVFADVSYAFTVALRRAILGTKGNNSQANQPPKKERSLPWWDDMRYYIHGNIGLHFCETKWNLLATTDPYENLDKLHIVTGYMEILQSDGHVSLSSKEFKAYLSSLESLVKNCSLKLPCSDGPFLYCPALSIDVGMIWECDSGSPLNHYLHALPREGKQREKVLDPFRSTSLAFRWNISLKPSLSTKDEPSSASDIGESGLLDRPGDSLHKLEGALVDSPTVNLGAHDIAWLFKWWNLVYLPPHKLRSFSRWPRFGVPRVVRSGNLSLDKVMTEFFLRLDATPTWIKHMPLGDDDPASGLTFKVTKLKLELCYSRGKQKFTFESKRDPLDLCYQGLDLHLLKAYLNRIDGSSVAQDLQLIKGSQTSTDKFKTEKSSYLSGPTEKYRDDGFLLYSDYFTIRRQTPKADGAKILAWQEAGRKNHEMTFERSEFGNGSESDHARSDFSDDDGFNVVIADNCQRVFVYGLKLLWTIENRDAVWSWVGGISKAFQPPKPSPSRQYSQRKPLEEQNPIEGGEGSHDDASKASPCTHHGTSSPSLQYAEPLGIPSLSPTTKTECSSNVVVNPRDSGDSEEEGTRHFMVNVVQPQFNLHSEEANGRFLLAAASGRILARSFHSVLHVGYDMIEQALGTSSISIPETEPEMTWKRVELSVMLEQVQAHVAPTDVDPGAGLQWLPKILRSSPKVKRTGALLERVFTPCQMYFRYTRHKGGTPELKVKPLKELKFNSPNIQATMTSRQFQVMLDVLTNLLFARLPKPRKSSLSYPTDDDEDVEEEADEVVPDGVEEVELARISIEEKERERKLILDDIRTLSVTSDISVESGCPENDSELWMITGGKSTLVSGLKKDLGNIQTSRKEAYSALRISLQKAAQLRLMEKEKNKSPSYAMRISMRISKVVWSMLADDKAFAEAEINDMIYDFDRDYKDIGVAEFTTKSFVVRNCLPNAKSDMLLSAWNPPPEWGKNVMLRVNAKQGAPKDENSLLELFQVEIYPLKIHLTETMYRMMWEYFFPEEEQDSQRRQEVWKVSTTAGARRVRKSDASASSSQSATKDSDLPKKSGANSASSVSVATSTHGDSSQLLKLPNVKGNNVIGSTSELRRTSSFDRTWEETVAESVANEIVLQMHSSNISTKSGPLNSTSDHQHAVGEETSKSKTKDSKPVKTGRLSHEEKKVGKAQDEKGKTQDEKRARARKMMEFHNIKISQVELLVTYEGSRFAVGDLRLLMDTFHRDDFTGTWRRLFSRVKKHIIWGVLKSVTGMQGKKFKDKAHNQKEVHGGVVPESELNFSDSDGGQPGKSDHFPIAFSKRPTDGAGDGFVSSVKGLFSSQRRKAKAFVLRTMRGEAENEFQGEWSESDAEFSPFARQLTITKAKKLIRRHTKKFRARTQKNSDFTASSGTALQQEESHPSSPREASPFQSDSSGGSSDEEFNE